MSRKSSNPMFNEDRYGQVLDAGMATQTTPMTVDGAVNKTLILMGVMLATALLSYTFPNQLFMYGGIIGGLVVSIFMGRNPSKAPVLAPIFAALEGLLVGTVTAIYASMFDGIIFQAVTATFAILFMMLALYKSGMITVTEKFRAGVSMAVGAIMLLYLVNFVLHLFGVNIPYLHDGGTFSIGITLVIIGVASMNLLLDFDNFEKGEAHRMPDYMEWYFGAGLLFTLVWLYLEILRLLSYLSSD